MQTLGIQRNVRHSRYLKIMRGNAVPKDGEGREVRRREEIDGHDCLVYTKGVAMLYATIHFYLPWKSSFVSFLPYVATVPQCCGYYVMLRDPIARGHRIMAGHLKDTVAVVHTHPRPYTWRPWTSRVARPKISPSMGSAALNPLHTALTRKRPSAGCLVKMWCERILSVKLYWFILHVFLYLSAWVLSWTWKRKHYLKTVRKNDIYFN